MKTKSESESEVAQSCPTLCDPVDCSPPGSSVHGILQARMLEWVVKNEEETEVCNNQSIFPPLKTNKQKQLELVAKNLKLFNLPQL